jgi:hypothetical protein
MRAILPDFAGDSVMSKNIKKLFDRIQAIQAVMEQGLYSETEYCNLLIECIMTTKFPAEDDSDSEVLTPEIGY